MGGELKATPMIAQDLCTMSQAYAKLNAKLRGGAWGHTETSLERLKTLALPQQADRL